MVLSVRSGRFAPGGASRRGAAPLLIGSLPSRCRFDVLVTRPSRQLGGALRDATTSLPGRAPPSHHVPAVRSRRRCGSPRSHGVLVTAARAPHFASGYVRLLASRASQRFASTRAARGADRARSRVSNRCGFPGPRIPATLGSLDRRCGLTSPHPHVPGGGIDAGNDGSSLVRRTRCSVPPTSRGTRRSRPSASSSRLRPGGSWMFSFVGIVAPLRGAWRAAPACRLLALRASQRGASSGAHRGAAQRSREA